MTDKEFDKFVENLADDTDRGYAREAWDSMMASERAACTEEQMEGYIEDTYKAVEEQKLRDVPKDKIFVAVLDGSYYEEHGDYPENFDSGFAYKGYVFDTPEEFVEKWYDLPEGDWYWCFNKGELFCSGAMDPGDIEIFEEYFEMTFDAPEEELEDDLDLPESVTISADELDLDMDDVYGDEEEIADIVSDYLSDTYGFCHYGFDMDVVYNELNEPSEFVVSDIKWDVDEDKDIDRLIDDAKANAEALAAVSRQQVAVSPVREGREERS